MFFPVQIRKIEGREQNLRNLETPELPLRRIAKDIGTK
jgi:hypothetical protein